MPNFLIIGTMKGGTTSLHAYLKQHPQVFMPEIKETRFFALEKSGLPECENENENRLWKGSITRLEDYQALFEGVTEEKAIGESCPLYMAFSAQSAKRIKYHIPDTKLIAVLRNPVDRAYSHFAWLRRTQFESIDNFADAWHADNANPKKGYKMQGLCAHLLRPYFRLFKRSQFRFYNFDDLKENPLQLIQDMFQFLEVNSDFAPDMSNQHNTSPADLKAAKQTQLPIDLKRELLAEFRADIEKLPQLTGLDVSRWLSPTS